MVQTLQNSTVFLAFIPLLLGLYIFRKVDFGIKAMIALVFVSVSSDLLNMLIHTEQSGKIITRVYSFFEFELTSLFFFAFAVRKWYKQLIVVLMIVFPVIVFTDAKLSEDRRVYDNLVMVCESIVFVSFSIAAYYRMMTDMQYNSITVTPKFWMTSAILVYFGGAIFVFSTVNYASAKSQELFEIVWGMHAGLRIAYVTLLTITLWKVRKQYR